MRDTNPTCPQCHSLLASSEVGNLCVGCGYLQRRHHNHTPSLQQNDNHKYHPHDNGHDDNNYPGDLEAPKGLDEILFAPTLASTNPDNNHHEAPRYPVAQKPQIINHRASSHYNKRLNKQLETLKTPEIESPIEPESSLEPGPPSYYFADNIKDSHSESQQSRIEDYNEPAPSNAVEPTKPHRPSPYLLNANDTEATNEITPSEHRHPSENNSTLTPPPLENNAITSKHHKDDPPAQKDRVMAQADALLKMASTSQGTRDSSFKWNYIIITITIMLLIGIGGFLTISLLQKPTPQPSTSSQSTTPNSSPTPSNRTESAKRDSERKDTLNTIAIALATYKKAHGAYPAGEDITALNALTSSDPPYIEEIKNDPLSNPASGLTIKYGYNSDGSQFTLTASLENKQDPDAVNGLYVVKSVQ